jgi:hypothetical protein
VRHIKRRKYTGDREIFQVGERGRRDELIFNIYILKAVRLLSFLPAADVLVL